MSSFHLLPMSSFCLLQLLTFSFNSSHTSIIKLLFNAMRFTWMDEWTNERMSEKCTKDFNSSITIHTSLSMSIHFITSNTLYTEAVIEELEYEKKHTKERWQMQKKQLNKKLCLFITNQRNIYIYQVSNEKKWCLQNYSAYVLVLCVHLATDF